MTEAFVWIDTWLFSVVFFVVVEQIGTANEKILLFIFVFYFTRSAIAGQINVSLLILGHDLYTFIERNHWRNYISFAHHKRKKNHNNK